MKSHQQIIAEWPNGVKQLAADLGVEYETARKWRVRNAIPSHLWWDFTEAAKAHGIKLTVKQLRDAAVKTA